MSNVGFIGLGVMGAPMARNIVRKGHALTVFDVNAKAVAGLVADGARAAATPKAVAEASEVVVTMLPDAPDVDRVALGADGILAGLKPGSVYIDMSTIDPETSRRIGAAVRRQGSDMIDSPVGKTAEHAVSGTLTLMVGGETATIARVRPVLDCMGTDFFHCGGLGAGHAMKCVNNLLATTLVAANAEALVAGLKAGLTLDVMTSVMQKTMAWNSQLAVAFPARPLKGDFEPGFMLRLAHKDCRLALAMNAAMGLKTPVGAATLAACQEGLDQGYGGKDVGVLLKLREDPAGVRVRLSPKP
ncbi:MAG: NAD(P)-dependent oxidoreductase [Alphaproteobacteria bacterium]|nr:NAD(P)-dependent oxidoreductase [Alphaproteobacteria bacterium]